MVSSLVFVTTLAFQFPGTPVNGFRPNIPDGKQADAANKVTVEMRGDIFMARKMYREAIEMYKSGPSDSAVLANKTGIAYHQLLDLDDARRWYQKAIRLRRDYPEAVNNMGTVYYATKSYRRAISQYKKALRMTPDSASILSNLGTAYFARKNYDLAFATYQEALKLDPDVFEHRSTMGVLLQDRTVEERAKFHYYLAKTYAKSGDVEHTLIYIRKALEEGFKESDKFKQEPEFAAARKSPEFDQILSAEHKVL